MHAHLLDPCVLGESVEPVMVLNALNKPPELLKPERLSAFPPAAFAVLLLYRCCATGGNANGTLPSSMLPLLLMLLLLRMLNMLRRRRVAEPARADRVVSGGCMKACRSAWLPT